MNEIMSQSTAVCSLLYVAGSWAELDLKRQDGMLSDAEMIQQFSDLVFPVAYTLASLSLDPRFYELTANVEEVKNVYEEIAREIRG